LDPDPVPIVFCKQLKDIGTEYCEGKWDFIGNDIDDGRWYYEKSKKSFVSRENFKIWVREFSDEKSKADEVGFKALYEIDCSRKMQRTITYISIKSDGTSKGLDSVDEWSHISPGTMMEILTNKVCKKTNKK
jgi:hypothetical protein